MNRVVVTGGGGFIGSHIVDRLCGMGHEVLVVDDFSTGDRDNLRSATTGQHAARIVEADISEPMAAAAVTAFRPDVMMLLAAQFSVKVSMRDPLLDARVNLMGLVRMLEAASHSGCRKVVFACSGGTIYGDDENALPIREGHSREPLSFYGLTKSAAVDYLRLYRRNRGLDYAALALGNVYGPRQTPSGEGGVVAIFAHCMLSGQPCVINGDGLTTRDYVHVSDVADAFVRAADRGHGLINVASAQERSVLNIFRALQAATGSTEPPIFGPSLDGEVRRISLDINRAQRELGWSPKVGLRAGIESVIHWLSNRELASQSVRLRYFPVASPM